MVRNEHLSETRQIVRRNPYPFPKPERGAAPGELEEVCPSKAVKQQERNKTMKYFAFGLIKRLRDSERRLRRPPVMVVLGTSHNIQGAEHAKGNIDDPSYTDLLKKLIYDHSIDFVFEEASGRGPTVAEKLTRARPDSNGYLDVDPSREERRECGIADSGSICHIYDDPSRSREVYHLEVIQEQQKREELWLQRISEEHFKNGLIVCGYLHTLSFAFRLQTAAFRVKAFSYVPHHKLCPLTQAEGGLAAE